MNLARVTAVILIVLGIVSLAYEGIVLRTREKERVFQLGSLKVDAMVERERHVPLPPVLGALSLVGGVVLLVMTNKNVRV